MLVTTDNSVPSETNFERASINNGLYPDRIDFFKEEGKSLKKTYRVVIGSWEESTYSLSYYTYSSNGTIGI